MLSAWERGIGRAPPARALLLLAATASDDETDNLARLSIGTRDSRLLALHEAMFGRSVHCMAECPACADRLELSIDVNDIRIEAPLLEGPDQRFDALIDDYAVDFRVPCVEDLLAVMGQPSTVAARLALLDRCASITDGAGAAVECADLPEHIVSAIAERMATADPQSDVQLAMRCPACAHTWLARFDVASFVWTEIDAWAKRLLRDVHSLARAYGWSECDILSLSPARRRLYLELIHA